MREPPGLATPLVITVALTGMVHGPATPLDARRLMGLSPRGTAPAS